MEPTVSGVGVLDKSVAVLDAVAASPRTLAELVTATGLSRATCHRLAVALEAHGLVRRDTEGRFTLGLRLIGLGRAASDRWPLAEAARPALVWLRETTGESVQLYVRDGEHRRCAVSFPSSHGLRWMVSEGALLPLHVGSAGRVLSGESGPGGWVETVEEREPGVASVSAPVEVAGAGVLAAVSIGGPVDRLTRSPGTRFGATVVAAAGDIAAGL